MTTDGRHVRQVTIGVLPGGSDREGDPFPSKALVVALCYDNSMWVTDDEQLGHPSPVSGEPTWRRMGAIPRED